MAKVDKPIGIIRDVWLVIGVTVLLLTFLEISISGLLLVRDQFADERSDADTYGDASWVSRYFEEFHQSSVSRWEPYVYWRRKAFSGEWFPC